ncbi:Lrp/AsnC family transcriptional regulator [Sphingomonas zeae]|jgi:DNA-binding Lrp family transcriptional regulator
MKLDAIDRRILAALQADGRLTNNDLAERVGLSPSPCLRRVRALEAAGTIKGYAAILDPVQLGLGTSVFVRVWLRGQDDDTVRRFNDSILALPQVMECHMMAGDCDFLLRVVASDLDAYRRFQAEKLARIDGVQSLKTDIPLQRVKLTGSLPL